MNPTHTEDFLERAAEARILGLERLRDALKDSRSEANGIPLLEIVSALREVLDEAEIKFMVGEFVKPLCPECLSYVSPEFFVPKAGICSGCYSKARPPVI